MPENPYLTVLALTKYIKRKFDADPHLRNVYVRGELSNVKSHPSGHYYFTLKDDKARILAVMFKMNAGKMKFRPENGMNVLVRGDVNVYEASGQYQLYVQSMQPDGIGELFLAYEQLKEKLAEEGLFLSKWKQTIPRLPKKIGVITATSGAAIRDICTTLNRRYPLAEVIVFPAIVQGPQAAPSIVRAIEQADRMGELDVLIVGRGGGSIEDLWAFNEEIVARAIFSAKVPIISAVGHETDTTIADFVADMRAPTPTAAAELAVPSREEILQRVFDQRARILSSLNSLLNVENKRLKRLMESYPLTYPERLYRPFAEKLANLEDRLTKNTESVVRNDRSAWDSIRVRMEANSPQRLVRMNTQTVQDFTHRLNRAALSNYQKDRNAFSNVIRTLKALNPLNVMERGFSVVFSENRVIKSVHELNLSEHVTLQMHDGKAEVIVNAIEGKKEGEQ